MTMQRLPGSLFLFPLPSPEDEAIFKLKALNEMTVSCTPVTSSYGVTSI